MDMKPKEPHTDFKAQIIQIASDMCLHQRFPLKTNQVGKEGQFASDVKVWLGSSGRAPYRVPDDGQPFGFEFHGVSIEVHINMVARTIPRTKSTRMVASLTIFGLHPNGLIKTIATGIIPAERKA
jgi:hypothetical protein